MVDFTVNVTDVAIGAQLTDRDIIRDTLRNAGISNAFGLWSEGTTLWSVIASNSICAYFLDN